jgi:hypothetical protein
MCTCARPYGRVRRCGFGGRGVTLEQQTPSAFHTPNEHNSSQKKLITHKRIRTGEEFQ